MSVVGVMPCHTPRCRNLAKFEVVLGNAIKETRYVCEKCVQAGWKITATVLPSASTRSAQTFSTTSRNTDNLIRKHEKPH